MAGRKKLETKMGETKPIFALKPPKRPALPRHSIAAKPETMAAMDNYLTWAADSLAISFDEAQAQFLEVAIPELILKDFAYRAHLKATTSGIKESEQ